MKKTEIVSKITAKILDVLNEIDNPEQETIIDYSDKGATQEDTNQQHASATPAKESHKPATTKFSIGTSYVGKYNNGNHLTLAVNARDSRSITVDNPYSVLNRCRPDIFNDCGVECAVAEKKNYAPFWLRSDTPDSAANETAQPHEHKSLKHRYILKGYYLVPIRYGGMSYVRVINR